ncbi:MAG: helix-turn-helix transcriptional regulator [Chlorobi bacterium]|nr:helix-turn-helix transcriptional regulator [Chlorobiota bacterium]
MENVGQLIRRTREKKELLLRHAAAQADIDQAILSKIERGERKASKDQIIRLAKVLGLDQDKLLIEYISDKIAYELVNEDVAAKALKVAERKITYFKKQNNAQKI